MSFRKFRQDALRVIGNYVLFGLASLLCRSLKINIKNGKAVEQFFEEKKRIVLAFWHGTMLIPWFVHRDKNFAALVSKSKDGGLLERVLKPLNYKVVRGSSHTGGSVALGVLVDLARHERSVAITPDGPRGPVHKLKAGAVVAAKRANVPLVLLGVGYQKKRELSSWDKFQVPKFFSRINLIYSDPIVIDQDLSYEETTKLIETCENKLNELQREAEIF
ncbi:MAG: DUF374 domain-containing protein [Ignavibacteriales bacterium]|nr:MAG: DUF374 domain-containing protein [Ignavibacteriales bacterium]